MLNENGPGIAAVCRLFLPSDFSVCCIKAVDIHVDRHVKGSVPRLSQRTLKHQYSIFKVQEWKGHLVSQAGVF
jgi:hypothetical protein